MFEKETLDWEELLGEEESQASKTSVRIQRLIMRSGLSVNDFAKKYHIARRSLENWITLNERSHREPSEVLLFLLEKAVDTDYPLASEDE